MFIDHRSIIRQTVCYGFIGAVRPTFDVTFIPVGSGSGSVPQYTAQRESAHLRGHLAPHPECYRRFEAALSFAKRQTRPRFGGLLRHRRVRAKDRIGDMPLAFAKVSAARRNLHDGG